MVSNVPAQLDHNIPSTPNAEKIEQNMEKKFKGVAYPGGTPSERLMLDGTQYVTFYPMATQPQIKSRSGKGKNIVNV